MSYHKILGFAKEPFSTSPDPDFLYLTRDHEIALTNLLIELRLRRGLGVVFGDIGTGKTTLSRKLVQELRKRSDMIFHIILNPAFENEHQLLVSLIKNFNIQNPMAVNWQHADVMELRDMVEKFLIQKTLEENKTVILIVDESQKLDIPILETLRLLLNFETNEHKLIQLVLFGQLELYAKVLSMANFHDRISFKYTLNPLTLDDTKRMIEHRLKIAGLEVNSKIFLDESIREIYSYTGGYPRRINMLCHQVLKELVVQNGTIVDRYMVKEVIERQTAGIKSEAVRDNGNFSSMFSAQSVIG